MLVLKSSKNIGVFVQELFFELIGYVCGRKSWKFEDLKSSVRLFLIFMRVESLWAWFNSDCKPPVRLFLIFMRVESQKRKNVESNSTLSDYFSFLWELKGHILAIQLNNTLSEYFSCWWELKERRRTIHISEQPVRAFLILMGVERSLKQFK